MSVNFYQPSLQFTNAGLQMSNVSEMAASYNLSFPVHVEQEMAVAKMLGGGTFDYKTFNVIPAEPSLIYKIYECTRNFFYRQIDRITSGRINYCIGLNTADDIKSLREDAEIAAPLFVDLCNNISTTSGGTVHFGPNDSPLKSSGSLRRKIHTLSKQKGISFKEAASEIGDALRGTISVDHPSQFNAIFEYLNNWISQINGTIYWNNYFNGEKDNGYVGVHATILLPFVNPKGEYRQIRTELQIHFRSIADGTENSPKERLHSLYVDRLTSDTSSTKPITKLVYLTGLLCVGAICMNPFFYANHCE